jgi:transposase-like protein
MPIGRNKKPQPHTWSQNDRDRLIRNFNNGTSLSNLSKVYGVTNSTIRSWIGQIEEMKTLDEKTQHTSI